MSNTVMSYGILKLQRWVVTMYKLGLLLRDSDLVDEVLPVGVSMEYAVDWFNPEDVSNG